MSEQEQKVKMLCEAGLKYRGRNKYSIGSLTITEEDIASADFPQLMQWEMEIEQEVEKLSKSNKKPRGVAEALDQPSTDKGPLSGKVAPEPGKHRSTLSHVQEIRDFVKKQDGAFDPIPLILGFCEKKIESLQNL